MYDMVQSKKPDWLVDWLNQS